MKFKLNTKVISASREGDRVSVKVDAAKGGKEETVSLSALHQGPKLTIQLDVDAVLVAIGRRPVTESLNLGAIGVELDKRGRIVIDDQFNTSAKGVRAIGDVTFGPMLAHKAEEEGTFIPMSTRMEIDDQESPLLNSLRPVTDT